MINPDDIPALVSRMWLMHTTDMAKWDTIHGYVKGERGLPHIPEHADEEIKEIRRISIHNVLTLVIDAFVQNLSVTGYRNGDTSVHEAGWDWWQRNQMDARQAEIYSSAVKYGITYVVLEPGERGQVPLARIRSPRQVVATYNDPLVDRWPQYALETWIDTSDARPRRRGFLIDDVMMWPLDLGPVVATQANEDNENVARRGVFAVSERAIGEPVPHGAIYDGEPVCPVVRYVNRRDAEDVIDGEIERLLRDQRAINEVNFDRLIVGRFGAFPQTVLSRWESMPDDPNTVLKASARRVWGFTEDVAATRLPGASLDPYNSLLESLEVHVAMRAQISPAYITGKMVNLSAEALAAAEANMHRKLTAMRESHGEAHEQLIVTALAMSGSGDMPTDDAEVVWRDTEARSFGAIVDGLFKIGQALKEGYPIEPLLPLIPGLSQSMITAVKDAAERVRDEAQMMSITDLVGNLRGAAEGAAGEGRVAELTSERGAVVPNPSNIAQAPAPGE